MTTKQAINPPGMAKPMGPYVQVTWAPPGARMVFCSGAVAFAPDGSIVGVGDIVAQTRQTMEKLKMALDAAGATFGEVMKITNDVSDVAEDGKIAPVREEYLTEPYPASSMVEVKGLMSPDRMIESEAIAMV